VKDRLSTVALTTRLGWVGRGSAARTYASRVRSVPSCQSLMSLSLDSTGDVHLGSAPGIASPSSALNQNPSCTQNTCTLSFSSACPCPRDKATSIKPWGRTQTEREAGWQRQTRKPVLAYYPGLELELWIIGPCYDSTVERIYRYGNWLVAVQIDRFIHVGAQKPPPATRWGL
jgi:hypothetical protein